MRDLFYLDSIFNDLDLVLNRFKRPVKDNQPYSVYKKEDGFLIVVNTLGLSKDDITVDTQGKQLVIEGKCSLEEIDFTNTVNIRLGLQHVFDKIDSINWSCSDGLTYITIALKEKEEKKIAVEYKE